MTKVQGASVAVLALALAGFANLACAETYAVKNGSVSADISATQMSRVTVQGDKIASVHTIDDPNAPGLLVQNDDKTGDMYVGFDGDSTGRTYSVFVTTATGSTFQLLLHPAPVPPSTIEVVPEVRKGQSAGPSSIKSPGYSETLVAFMKMMFNEAPAEGVSYSPATDPGQTTANYVIRTVGYYKTDGLRGIVLYITNRSTLPQNLLCEQFLVRQVLSCGVSNEMLKPGESARVYIVEEAQ